MKLAICGDVHMCKQSSIITSMSDNFTKRLENCIASVNWFEKTAVEQNCDKIIYLGDFFNRSELDDMTITAAKQITWSAIPKYMLVGNHDSSDGALRYSATKMLEANNFEIISTPTVIDNLCFLPYIAECDRLDLKAYFKLSSEQFIFSHNDISGIYLGPVETKFGFRKDEIEATCKLFINGHLHNGDKIGKNIINVGILTGQNFGEDAERYAHRIMILDTDTAEFTFIENPYAFNFYKLDILSTDDLNKLDLLKSQAVLSIRCAEQLVEDLHHKLDSIKSRISETRIITIKDAIVAADIEAAPDLTMDHIAKFCECCRLKIDNNSVLEEELAELCK